MAFTFRLDTKLTMAGVSDGLTDGETEARALDEIVELDETLEDLSLMLFGNACTSIFAIDIQIS